MVRFDKENQIEPMINGYIVMKLLGLTLVMESSCLVFLQIIISLFASFQDYFQNNTT